MGHAARLHLCLVLIAVGIAASGPSVESQQATPGLASADPTQAERFLDVAFNQGGSVADLVTANFVFHLASERHDGPEAFTAFVAAFRAAFPDLHVAVQTVFAQEDRIAARFTLRGTQAGPFQDIPATNRAVLGVPGHAVFRVEGERIAEIWALIDVVNLLQHLGVVPGTPLPADAGPPSPPPGTPPDDGTVAVVERYHAAYAAGDATTLAQVIAEDWVGHPAGAAVAPGREGWEQNYAAWRAIFPDAHLVVEEIVAAGDLVAVRAIVRGTQHGSFGDIAPTGRETAFEVIDLWLVRDGQLAESWSVGDYLGLVAQLEGEATPPA